MGAFALCLLLPAAQASPYYLVDTSQSGTQTDLDNTQLRFFSFTPTWNWFVGGGEFVMKVGPNTSASATLALFADPLNTMNQYTNATTLVNDIASSLITPLASVSRTPDGFDQDFDLEGFYFSLDGFQIPTLQQYTLVLYSTASTVAAFQYFIKEDQNSTYEFVDENNNPVPPNDPGGVPEPASMMLTGSAMLAAGVIVRLRRRAS
jgi:hypothetical protein